MKCIYCNETFKSQRGKKDNRVCQSCDGSLMDFSLLDSEVALEVQILQNPGGKSTPKYDLDFDDDH